MRTLAISISAGGSKAAWSLGFLRRLLRLRPVLLSRVALAQGSSSGSLVAGCVAIAAIEHSLDPLTEGLRMLERMGQRKLGASTIHAAISTVYLDEIHERVIEEGIDLGVCVVPLATGLPILVRAADTTAGYLRTCMLASCAVPGLIPPIPVAGLGRCTDGGVASMNPERLLVDSPAFDDLKGLLVLDYQPQQWEVSGYARICEAPISVWETALSSAMGVLGQMMGDSGASLITASKSVKARLDERKRGKCHRKIRRVRATPTRHLPPSLSFSRDTIRYAASCGAEDAERFLAALPNSNPL